MKRRTLLVLLVIVCIELFPIDRGSFGEFRRSLNNTSYGYKIIDDPTGKAPLKEVEVFEVRPGDSGKDQYYDDTQNDRERSEVSEVSKDQLPGNEFWYGYYIFIPEDYPNVYPVKVALGQFHQEDTNPAWMFENEDGGYWLFEQIYGEIGHKYKLINDTDLRGKWHKLEMHIRWSKNNDGFFNLWIDQEQKVQYSGQTMSGKRAYFKYGIYRSYISRYFKKYETKNVPTQKVYYCCVKRGNSKLDIQPDQ
jgi:hypothetical protein